MAHPCSEDRRLSKGFVMNGRPSEVVVAMSGGVDSSLAAALLTRAGWRVHGLHLLLSSPSSSTDERLETARRVASYLGIPLEVMDLRACFQRVVVEPFVNAYRNGLTPNPCVVCNARIKFQGLLLYANGQGIPYLSTGHYATVKRQAGTPQDQLWRGEHRSKDQSYFLHRIGQDALRKAVFPLGGMGKDEVRSLARRLGLPSHGVPESQEICFLPQGDYRILFGGKDGPDASEEGNLVNGEGRILGRHSGIYRYTVGQRQGLGIASSKPYYVKEIRTETKEVVVGGVEELYSRELEAEEFHWIGEMPSEEVLPGHAQIRSRHQAASGRLEIISTHEIRFVFDEPQWAVTPGQALVLHEGDRVLGGGWIRKTREEGAGKSGFGHGQAF